MEWIKCSERMPLTVNDVDLFKSVEVLVTDGERVTATDCNAGIMSGGNFKFWCAFSEYGAMHPKDVTHWMPLPEPPIE
ncbi:DUF551 domain-containing protein [Atlantibacter hermannii]|uniref:DUF551 domain-containing protein n=1 Tax=Atlantibacter hermannii TaxID=565 RepID=UPI002897777B|nr:DUF551 domain-containing protein [Atlantibacter hermannii]